MHTVSWYEWRKKNSKYGGRTQKAMPGILLFWKSFNLRQFSSWIFVKLLDLLVKTSPSIISLPFFLILSQSRFQRPSTFFSFLYQARIFSGWVGKFFTFDFKTRRVLIDIWTLNESARDGLSYYLPMISFSTTGSAAFVGTASGAAAGAGKSEKISLGNDWSK